MKEIVKKCEYNMFEKILSGEKNFDVRLGDFQVKTGDIIILKEVKNGSETGRELRKKVGFYLRTKELPYWTAEEKNKSGFIVMQLEELK